MTGAMYAAISGMKSHMNKLNVIGNNVANVNTYGYKAGTVSFRESIYTTMTSGSNGTGMTGGVNPAQFGYGCSIGTIDLDMSAKTFVPTGIDMHSMITGDGFYMVGDKSGGINSSNVSSLSLSRVGNFKFDSDGYLVDGSGMVVYGFVSASGEEGGGAARDFTNPGQTDGVSTELVPIRLPLSARAPADPAAADAVKEGSAVYHWVDDDGKTHQADSDANSLANPDGKCIQLESVSINKDGKIMGINKATKEPVVVGYVPLASVDNPSGVTHMEGPYYKALGGAGDVRVAAINGVVTGYMNNLPTGDPDLTTNDMIMGSGGSELQTGGLEGSGTDVAVEFSEMITTQRGYQANTRIITVTDAMLEELVNIKR